ncbi:MAG: C4-dicarboxylate ABC transporter permease [Syntrophus sp. (in: bacteria)]|nr:C4-dicarboxylate ABC transporter permease [Syntrophus sp. (in: bacteria)]
MNDVAIGIVAIAILMALFLTGIELAFAMALIGFLGYAYLVSFSAACNLLAKDFFETFSSYTLTVIPLFVLMGQIAYNSGTAKRLYGAAYKFVGHVPGGLAMTTVVAATLFKAMCGSTLATAATFASLAVPEMQRYGYSRKLSTGIVASVGTLGVIFPPSITLIIFGLIAEQSIGQLFLAGIIPGLMISLFFMCIIYGWVKINPSIAPKAERFSWKERIRSVPDLLWVAIIFTVVMGGLMKGFFSPTEAATIGTVAVLIVAFGKEHLPFKKLIISFDESLRTGCMVLTLLAGSAVLGHFLAITEIPMMAADWTAGLSLNRNLILICIMLIYLIGGSFIDDLAFMILATPIFYPVVQKLGFDPIWFGIMIGITVMIGAVIPPVAMCVFVVKKITGEDFKVIYGGVYPFLLSLFACAVILFIFPQIATFLPGLFMK